jgi:hypothetical protein
MAETPLGRYVEHLFSAPLLDLLAVALLVRRQVFWVERNRLVIRIVEQMDAGANADDTGGSNQCLFHYVFSVIGQIDLPSLAPGNEQIQNRFVLLGLFGVA